MGALANLKDHYSHSTRSDETQRAAAQSGMKPNLGKVALCWCCVPEAAVELGNLPPAIDFATA